MKKTKKFWLYNWRYKNTSLLAVSVIILIIFADHAIVRGIVGGFSSLEYLGIFLAGLFFVSTFTVVPATLLLTELSKSFGYWETVLIATLGSIVGDFLIFRFVKSAIADEFRQMFSVLSKEQHIKQLFHSPFFIWLTPVVGAILIASPLPDEIGVSLLGITKMSNKKFLIIATVLDFIGISLLVSVLKSL